MSNITNVFGSIKLYYAFDVVAKVLHPKDKINVLIFLTKLKF